MARDFCSKGAFYATSGSSFTITSSHFVNNSASSGGALSLLGCGGKAQPSTISQSIFSGNQALSGNGGAIRSQSCPPFTVSATTFDGNKAQQVRMLQYRCRCIFSPFQLPKVVQRDR